MDFSSGWVTKIYEKLADPLVSKIKGITKDEWEKFEIDSDIAFIKYFENAYEKYSKIKTILYRTEPKFILYFRYFTLFNSARYRWNWEIHVYETFVR